MKTPRQILLDRHQEVAPKLSRIREHVIAENLRKVSHPDTTPVRAEVGSSPGSFFHSFWMEFVLPAKRIWIGFAAVWVVILGVSFADSTPGTMTEAESQPVSAAAMVAWMDQKRILAELFQRQEFEVADRPRPTLPKPRSQRGEMMKVC